LARIILIAGAMYLKRLKIAVTTISLMPLLFSANSVSAANAQAEALYKRAQAHKENFDTKQQALKEIDQALAIDPKNSRYLSMKAIIITMVTEDGDAEALKYTNEAIKYEPGNADALNLKAQIYMHRKNFAEALKCSSEAVKRGNNHWLYRTTHAEILNRLGQKSAAIKELDECNKQTKNNPSSLSLRAVIAESDKDWNTSIKLRTMLIAMTGKTSISMLDHYIKRAEAYEALKQYDKAIADLNAAAKVSTLNHGVHYKLLNLYKLKGDKPGIDRETSFIKSLEEDMRPL
jgi:tetratricopeptide (TPR) repeat protein